MSTTTSALTGLALALSLSACVITTDGDSTLTVDNASDYAIYEVYLAEENQPDWGPELLRGDILYPDESLIIHSIDCGYYDVSISDEYGAQCELNNIDLCFNDAHWVITNSTLSACPIFR